MRVAVLASLGSSLINFRGPLLKAMVDAGHEVIGLAPDEDADLARRLAALGVRYEVVPLNRTGMNPLQDFRTLRALEKRFRELKPSVLLSYTIKPVIYGSLAARLAGVDHIYAMITGLGYSFMGQTLKQRVIGQLARLLYRTALANCRKVFFQNPDDSALFERLNLVAPQKTVLINGSGVDLDHFCQAPVPTEPVRFLLIARLLKDKGVAEYAAAARQLKARYPDARFRLLGPFDPNPASITEAQLEVWVSEGTLEYLGTAPDVRQIIADASVYVLPSYREGTPRTVLEAMAMGRPVITTDAPGCRETVRNGENGFLVSPQNAGELADAMRYFIEQPERILTMGAKSRDLAETKYDVHQVNNIVLSTMKLKECNDV